jgi:hypothetical protein
MFSKVTIPAVCVSGIVEGVFRGQMSGREADRSPTSIDEAKNN